MAQNTKYRNFSLIYVKNFIFLISIITLFFIFNINIITSYGLYIEPFENVEIYIFDFLLLIIVIFCFLLKPEKLTHLLSYKRHYIILLILSLYILNSIINNTLSLKIFLSLTRLIQFYTVAYFLNSIFSENEIKKLIVNFILIYISFFIIETLIVKYNCIKPHIEYWYNFKDTYGPKLYYQYLDYIIDKHVSVCLASRETYFTINNILVFCMLILFSFIKIDLKNKFNKIILFTGMIFSLSINLFLSLFIFIILKIKKNIYIILIPLFLISIILLLRINEFKNINLDSSASIRLFLIYKYIIIFFQNNVFLGSGLLEATNPELHKNFYNYFFRTINNYNFLNQDQIHSFNKFYDYEFNFQKLPYNVQSTHNFYVQMLVELGIIFSIAKLYLLKLSYNISLFKKTLFIISIWLFFNSWFPGNPETLVILILLLSKKKSEIS